MTMVYSSPLRYYVLNRLLAATRVRIFAIHSVVAKQHVLPSYRFRIYILCWENVSLFLRWAKFSFYVFIYYQVVYAVHNNDDDDNNNNSNNI